ncbi:nucleoside-triphosphatase [Chloroflexota bacterium]
MVIIVTGSKGVGKTTVCRKLVEIVQNLGYTCGGILTYKDRDGDILIEDISTGNKEILASTHIVYHGPHTTKYSFNPKGIDFGVQAIDKGTSVKILVVDEIGYLELRAEGFTRVLEFIKVGKVTNYILVIRSELLSTFIPRLPTVSHVFKTTLNNRDQLPQEIVTVLLKKL